ncbi:MAG: hypothetical protein VYE22_33180 [Myxococcota bacterium]|nr:hypothetical protein [Myxococcota bacterium]
MRWLVFSTLLFACGGETPARESPAIRPAQAADALRVSPPEEGQPEEPEPEAAPPDPVEPVEVAAEAPDFTAPLPDAPCPDAVAIALAHADAPGLPPSLDRAVAFRSEDGRRLRVVLGNYPLERDERGRFRAPAPGEARFEMDALRTRRRPLEPRVLGAPGARRGALTHARIVWDGPFLTFGHREIGRVEITAVEADHVCGRVELDDGFGRVRGAFRAPLAGPLPP